jgi:signal transduction histidine kinase
MKRAKPSLRRTLRLLTIKWAIAGLALSLFAGGACLLYSSKVSSESQVKILAQSLGRAFRPQILNGDIRDAQLQIEFVLSDISGAHSRVLDSNFNEIYPLPGDQKIDCKSAARFCWSGLNFITYLHPIYFDDDKKESIYGYLALTAPTSFNFPILFSFGALILLLFVIQGYGLTSALNQISKNIMGVLSTWSNHLSNDPREKVQMAQNADFKEFAAMEQALNQLHLTIAKLEEESAKQAKEKAQISIVREIGHDLKTPLSQVSKHFYLLSQEAAQSPGFNRTRANEIEKIFKRMGDLIRQIKDFRETKPRELETVNLDEALKDFLESAERISDDQPVRVDSFFVSNSDICIQKIRLYQIIDNLVRNAREATPVDGVISISVKSSGEFVDLTVQDSGSGIPDENRDRIFDIDFTTKPGKGTGLGLGIVKRICAENGATISVESEIGIGSKFTVRFPLAENAYKNVLLGEGEMTV